VDLAKIRKKAKGAAAPRAAAVDVSGTTAEAAAPPDPEPRPAPDPPPPPPREVEPKPLPAPPAPGSAAPEAPSPEAELSPATPGRVEKLLVFTVGRRRYAIPIHDISQIIEEHAVTPVPHAPAFLMGIFSLRGRIVSVLDAGLRLGVQAVEGETSAKVVVLDVGEELFGIRVHGIDTVAEVDLGALEPPPESFRTQEQEFVEGVFHHRERTVSFLNLPLFLAFNSGGEPA